MRILLQNTKTLKFIREPKHRVGQGWTSEQANARSFATGLEAVYYCYQHAFANMQMFVAFDDPERDFTVPVVDTPKA